MLCPSFSEVCNALVCGMIKYSISSPVTSFKYSIESIASFSFITAFATNNIGISCSLALL
ncbi:MAG: hypothetical protein DRG78_04910 [Epsilonproteobacteria bacterium]|nr:MAG: hypothetical protein DRG78_04910 [Campylobacterota bacterium]